MPRPIDLWPVHRHRGRPGYSGRGLDAVSPHAPTPLSVASTIASLRIHEEVRQEAEVKSKSGEEFSVVLDWIGKENSDRNAAEYAALCQDIYRVIAVLKNAVPQTPGIRNLLKQAERAERTGTP